MEKEGGGELVTNEPRQNAQTMPILFLSCRWRSKWMDCRLKIRKCLVCVPVEIVSREAAVAYWYLASRAYSMKRIV
eukprot:scaffold60984_cov47-Attheya_sp.AAC.2